MRRKEIPEIRYRASRICRALGNPMIYEIIHLLKKKRTPQELADTLGVSISCISKLLRSLRQLDLIRYEVRWRMRHYWLKTTGVSAVTTNIEELVKTIDALR